MGERGPDGRTYTTQQIEAVNQALMLVQRQFFDSPPLSLGVADLQAWHAALATPLGILAGQWRKGEITFGSYYGYPPSEIDTAVRATFMRGNEHLAYVRCLDSEPELQLEELIRVSAYVHAQLIKIHPFEDGNGRASRLVLEAMFPMLGMNPPDIYSLERSAYINALNTYNSHGTNDLYCPALEPLETLLLELL